MCLIFLLISHCLLSQSLFREILLDIVQVDVLMHSLSILHQFKPEEITAIMNDFTEPGSLAPTGLYLGGTKYMVIQGEPGAVIRGKKVNNILMSSSYYWFINSSGTVKWIVE